MCDYLNEHGHCCGRCSEQQRCEVCGDSIQGDFFRCECGSIACLECTAVCDICNETYCLDCWQAAKDEAGGGTDADGSGIDVCYGCAEKGVAVQC